MKIIENTIVSDELFDVCFVCNLKKCKGACCVDGDSGAPLEPGEIGILEDCIDEIRPYMTEEGLKTIEETGLFDYDVSGNFATPLNEGKECAYTYAENGITSCAIERAYKEGKINFIKPISCHLYPVRLKKYNGFEAVNYHRWQVCETALVNGKRLGIPMYKFLKEPLIRKFGKQWYDELLKAVG